MNREDIERRLTEIVKELDDIGVTLGMQRERVALRTERDALLDELIGLLKEDHADEGTACTCTGGAV